MTPDAAAVTCDFDTSEDRNWVLNAFLSKVQLFCVDFMMFSWYKVYVIYDNYRLKSGK